MLNPKNEDFGARIKSNTYTNNQGKIVFDADVTKMGNEVFNDCSKLTSITIPSSVTSIGSYAFRYCSLTSIDIPEGVTIIGNSAFSDCKSLTSITIPSKVKTIDSDAFYRCLSLTSVTFSPNSELTSLGHEVFRNCSSLTSIDIPEGVTEIYFHCFNGCSALTKVTLPSTLTMLDFTSFALCTSLKEINIPAKLSLIEKNMFDGCTSLESVTLEGHPNIDPTAFKNCNYDLLTITVVDGDHDYQNYLKEQINYDIANGKIIVDDHVLEDGKNYSHGGSYDPGNPDPVSGKTDNFSSITWKRTFTKDCWQTMCLPFALTEEEWTEMGLEIAKPFHSYVNEDEGNRNELHWQLVSGETEAGKPYLVKPNSAGLEIDYQLKSVRKILGMPDWDDVKETEVGEYKITGTYSEMDIAETNKYALSNGTFYRTNDHSKKLPPYRFNLERTGSSSAPIVIRILGADGETTVIESVELDELLGGDSTANTATPAYTLQGIRVGSDYKGFVIVNGKKVLRK